jgi:ornithine cyclodeaminase/alanine dehydrogenase-like protein (mu-crystallin family)
MVPRRGRRNARLGFARAEEEAGTRVSGDAGAAPQALLLSRGSIAKVMDLAAWLEAAELGFRAHADAPGQSPPPMAIAATGGAFHAKGASIRLDQLYVALKLNGNFPANSATRGLPTIQGVVLLCSGETGALLAIMDSIEITRRRTAAATALAARILARPDSQTLLLCGCGDQAEAQLAALTDVLPLRRLLLRDRDASRAASFATRAKDSGLEISIVDDLADAARSSDVIVTCTTATRAFLKASFVAPGTFVAAVGADSPAKSEIDPDLVADSFFVTDSTAQCIEIGDLHHAVKSGRASAANVDAQLGALVASEEPITIPAHRTRLFDSTGIGIQDAAAAALIYRRALAAGSARKIALGAWQ